MNTWPSCPIPVSKRSHVVSTGLGLTFAAADHEALVCAAKPAPDSELAARVSRVLLRRNASLQVDQDSLVVRLVDEHVFRVAADAERCGTGIERQIVQVLPRAIVVDMQSALFVHSDQPALIGREGNVLGSVRLRERVDAVPKRIPLAEGLALVERTRDECLPVCCPHTAAHWLAKLFKNPHAFSRLYQPFISIK